MTTGDDQETPREEKKTTEPEMAFRMRSSKFRHVYGNPAKKELCYECIKITKNAHDSNFCAVNPKFVAIVTESAGGGAFLVLPLEKTGRVDINTPKVCGHAGPVLDIRWNPFNDFIIASCSDDATVKLWQIPEGGLKENLTEWLVDLHGHQRRVGHLAWHPTTENILLSSGYDFKCILWNTETAEPINIISVHTDTIFSIAWNYDGSLFATTSKDKKIRVIDAREGVVIQEGVGHAGSKSSKVVFVGEHHRLFTTGFSRMSERQYAVWDSKNLDRALKIEVIDSSSGVLFPFYDHDTGVVFVAGKGDGNIRYYELVEDAPYCYYLNQYQSSSPQRGLGLMPKRGIDPRRCEIMRLYKLHAVKGICEPISMIVPRKSEMFQDDIFPPTASACPSLSADEWISGQNRQPILISLKDLKVVSVPKTTQAKAVQRKPPEDRANMSRSSSTSSATSSSSSKSLKNLRGNMTFSRSTKKDPRKDLKKESVRKDSIKKDGAVSNSPTITTFKAVKRGVSAVALTTVERGLKKQSTAPPTATIPPSTGRLPASIHNIRKMTSVEDGESETTEVDNENHNTVNDRISSFEKKTSVMVTKSTTRLTNNNQPLRVDKKVWSTSYTGVNANMNIPPESNGLPRTDPEMRRKCSIPRWKIGKPDTPIESQLGPLMFPQEARVSSESREAESSVHSNQNSILEQAEEELYANLEIDNPHRKTRLERKWSRISDSGSEQFSTPPTSPLSAKCDVSSVLNTPSGVSDISGVMDTPSVPSWKSNPLYVTSSSPPPRPRALGRGDGRTVYSPPPQPSSMSTASEPLWVRDSRFRRSLRSTFRNNRKDSEPRPRYNSTVSPTSVGSFLNGTTAVEENNNKVTTDLNDNAGSALIDLEGCFPTDAPDHTLIKPSKLRASLRGRRGRRLTNPGASTEPQESTAHPATPRNVVIVENQSRSRSSIASCTAQEKISYPSPPVIPYNRGTISPEPLSPSHNDSFERLDSEALIRSSRLQRQSFRRQHNSASSADGTNSFHVKKVWSPAPEPSPTSPPSENGMIPATDAELRKAYFRQVEEITSLKEQIGLKDKRIRQLEEEVRVLRDSRELMGESTC